MLADLRARDPGGAARSMVAILVVCAIVLAGLTTFLPPDGPASIRLAPWLAIGVIAATALSCAVVPPERLDRLGVWPLIALGGGLVTCLLNLLTGDTSAAAQAFLAFPVLWVASHLRTGAVVLVTGGVVAADAVTLVLLLPLGTALTDVAFFGAVLVVMAVMLVRAGATQERLVAALQEQARVDALTGLVNRRVFEEALVTTASEPRSHGTALVLIDVDSFKSINDVHGHLIGDDVLVHLASVLREQVRADDAVLSRLGGDELAVLLPHCGADVAERRGEELLHAVRARPLTLPDGTLLALSISVGVAHARGGAGDVRSLYSAADAALYAAKRGGRGRVAVATA